MSTNGRNPQWADQPTEDLPIFPPSSGLSTRAGHEYSPSGASRNAIGTAPSSVRETDADLTSYTDWAAASSAGYPQGPKGATQIFETTGQTAYQDLRPDFRHDEQETEDLPPLDQIYAAERGGYAAGQGGNVRGAAYAGVGYAGSSHFDAYSSDYSSRGHTDGHGNTSGVPSPSGGATGTYSASPAGTYSEATEVLGAATSGGPTHLGRADYADPTPSGAINTGHFQPVDATDVIAPPGATHPGMTEATEVFGTSGVASASATTAAAQPVDATQVFTAAHAPTPSTTAPAPGAQSTDATQVLGAPAPATPSPGSQPADATQVMPIPGIASGGGPSQTTTAQLPADAASPSSKKKKRRKKNAADQSPAPTSPPPNAGPPLPRAEYARRLRQRVFGAILWAALAWGLGRVALITVWGQSLDTLAMEATIRFAETFDPRLTLVTGIVSIQVILGMAAVVVLIALARRRPTLAGRALGVILGANITVQVAKIFLVRPDLGVTTALGNSLPSGHAAVTISLCLALVIVAPEWGRGPAAWLTWIVSSMMGIVLMAQAWHRLADVLVAVLITGAWAMVLTPLESRVRHGVMQKKLMSWVAGACLVLATAVTLIAVLGVDPVAVSTPGGSGYGFSEFLDSEPIRARMLAMAACMWVVAVNGSVVTSVDRLSRR